MRKLIVILIFTLIGCHTLLAFDQQLGGELRVGNSWDNDTYLQESVSWKGLLHNWSVGGIAGIRQHIGYGCSFYGLQAKGGYVHIFEGGHQLEGVLSYNYSPYRLSRLNEHVWALYATYKYPHISVSLGYQIRHLHDATTSHSEFSNCLYNIEAYVWDRSKVPYNLYFQVHNFEPLRIERTTNVMFSIRAQYRQREPTLDYNLRFTFEPAGVGNIMFNHYEWRTAVCIVWHY